MKILVADDDAVSRCMMQRMLAGSGYEVLTARNGAEAMSALLDDGGPRLVLLDWMMPELDGPEVCRAIRSRSGRPYVYITLLTSREGKEDLVAGLEAGADDYLTKPCNGEELRARLRTGERILQLEDSLVEAREDMRFKATHDALTHLLDRGAILNRLSAELEKSRSDLALCSVVLCDVDHFKSINDTHGHPVGDEVLRVVADRLKHSVRAEDGVGRYGGEEFLLVLAGCNCNDLSARSEQIRNSVGALEIPTSVGPLRVSVSVGAVKVDARTRYHTSEHLLKEVDAALYRAKREGRNRVIISDALEAGPERTPQAGKLALCS